MIRFWRATFGAVRRALFPSRQQTDDGRLPYAENATFWRTIAASLPFAVTTSEFDRLQRLAEAFLHEKRFWGAHGFAITAEIAGTVAWGAALLAYRHGLALYRDFVGVILYSAPFRVRRQLHTEAGIESEWDDTLDGETWEQGPVLVTWQPDPTERWAVILHELAHRVDFACDGLWNRHWEAAWDTAHRAVRQGGTLPFDDYALTDPAEFVAVTAEAFFLTPTNLKYWDERLYLEWSRVTGLDPARNGSEPVVPTERSKAS